MVKKYSELCMQTRKAISAIDGELAVINARSLVALAAEKTPQQLLRDYDLYATDRAISRLEELLRQYLAGVPMAYLEGEQSFCGLTFKVTPDVLIPRDDTMAVLSLALEAVRSQQDPRILDLCTGSGCIGIAIAVHAPQARVTLADISDAALTVAKENIRRNGVMGRCTAVNADCLRKAPDFLGKFHVIVSNPPYITTEEMRELDVSVREHEPHLALWGGEDGLDFYRAICRNYAHALLDGGMLCLEFGMGQENGVREILLQYGFGDIRLVLDASGITRAVSARKMGKGE